MNNLEVLQKALHLLNQISHIEKNNKWSDSLDSSLDPDGQKALEDFQKISIRVGKILSQLDIHTTVNAYGRNFDVLRQAASNGDIMMVNLTIPLIRQAEGFLSDPGYLSESFEFNSNIDQDVQYRFMTNDYSGAVAKSFKIFKSKLHEHAGTDDVDVAIGKLREKWKAKNNVSSQTRDNFEKGISHLLSSLSRFRNVEFHSENWSVKEKQEAFYFIAMISMSLDVLDKYLDKSEEIE